MCLPPTFVYIPSHSGITAIFSAAALQSKKGPRPKENITVCFFLFCRCCYSCKQKSRHPIIPVGEREGETGPSPASPLPSKKKETEFGKDIIYQKHGLLCESTPLPLRYSLTHSPMFGIPETLPSSETLFFLSRALFVFLPCPATPNSKLCLSRPSQGLRFLSVCLICMILFRSLRPGARRHFFTLSLDTDTNLSRNRPYRRSIPLRALLTKTKRNKKKESLPR